MKNQVEYKLPKKMKKRRQLDALVDTVKLPRSRQNSTSAQELLDCQSDSSENDEFSLSSPGSKRKTYCCMCKTVVAHIGLFMVTMACLTTCAALVWVQWHIKHELDSLRKQVDTVQDSKRVSPEVLKLQAQIAEVNASVMSMKTGHGSIQEIMTTVTEMNSKLKELKDAHKDLQVPASESLLNLPKKMDMLTRTVATVGSDIVHLREVQTSNYEELKNKIASLEAPKEENIDESTSSDEQTRNTSLRLMNFTGSLKMGFRMIGQELDQQSARISVLEDFTKSHPESSKPSLNSSDIVQLVTELIENKLTNVTVGIPSTPDSSGSSQTPPIVVPVGKGEFLAFRADILENFQELNETFVHLNDELTMLTTHLESHDRALENLTKVITSLKRKTSSSGPFYDVASTTMPSSSTASASQAESSTEEPGKANKKLHIPGIDTWEDLNRAFKNDWGVKDGLLNIDSLHSLRNITLQKDDFKKFDQNGDNLYSEEEMAKALDLEPNPRR